LTEYFVHGLCFDAVGCVAERASGLYERLLQNPVGCCHGD